MSFRITSSASLLGRKASVLFRNWNFVGLRVLPCFINVFHVRHVMVERPSPGYWSANPVNGFSSCYRWYYSWCLWSVHAFFFVACCRWNGGDTSLTCCCRLVIKTRQTSMVTSCDIYVSSLVFLLIGICFFVPGGLLHRIFSEVQEAWTQLAPTCTTHVAMIFFIGRPPPYQSR